MVNALSLVFTYAFTPSAAEGGFAGAAVWAAIRFGVARGVFSNEAGLGSAPIAHAAAETKGPVNQGLIAMLGTFIDTIIVCSITGLAIISSGAWTSGESGAALDQPLPFAAVAAGYRGYLIAIALSIFAFTTILGWSFYGEKCVEFLLGVKSLIPYRVLWIVMIYFGATADLGFIWLLADTLNAMMAIPNLIALALLSPIVFKLTKEFFASGRPVGRTRRYACRIIPVLCKTGGPTRPPAFETDFPISRRDVMATKILLPIDHTDDRSWKNCAAGRVGTGEILRCRTARGGRHPRDHPAAEPSCQLWRRRQRACAGRGSGYSGSWQCLRRGNPR